jgi:hypothetical protein
LPQARERFDVFKDLVKDYASRAIEHPEFAARVRRRFAKTNEDTDLDDEAYYEQHSPANGAKQRPHVAPERTKIPFLPSPA